MTAIIISVWFLVNGTQVSINLIMRADLQSCEHIKSKLAYSHNYSCVNSRVFVAQVASQMK